MSEIVIIFQASFMTYFAVAFFRLIYCEFQFYRMLKSKELDIWKKLGSPSFLSVRIALMGFSGSKLFNQIQNDEVKYAVAKCKRISNQLALGFVGVLLIGVLMVLLKDG